jgi:CheY-like chemotaxis protein
MAGIRILAVDDEPLVGLSLNLALAGAGYSVDVASSGKEALERFRADIYDLVLTDFQMPGMTGLELAERLKSRNPSVRVILLSGSPPSKSPAIDRVMEKPFTIAELRNAIAQLLYPF